MSAASLSSRPVSIAASRRAGRLRIYGYVAALLALLFLATPATAQPESGEELERNPLTPVKTDSPRETMRTFMRAMNDYRQGVQQDDPQLKSRLQDAVRTLNLNETGAPLLAAERGEEAAILLKEVIDRIIVIRYDLIPGEEEAGAELPRWRLKDTEITIARVQEGERAGEYLFSPDTVRRAREFYEKVQELPYLENSGQGAAYEEPWVEEHVPPWMLDTFAYLNWWQWIGIAVSILLGLVLKVIIKVLVDLLKKLASKTAGDWDDKLVRAVSDPIGYLGAVGFWWATLYLLRLEGMALTVFSVSLRVIMSIFLVWLVYRAAGVLTQYLEHLADKTESTLDDQLVPLLSRTLKIIIVVVGALLVIQNLGINVLSLLAGLGIGGLAFALAARDTVANFFGSLMILFDRPFQVGDWIRVGDAEGTVEEIGFRSTRIRTFYNSVVSIPNSEVANTQIDNMGLRQYRRVYTTLGVTYDTPPETLEAFLEGCKNVIKANPQTRKDYFHVVFNDYGDSALEIMVYFFLETPDWSQELIARQNVFLEFLRLARELGVEFAFPTQTLHVESFPEKQPTRVAGKVETGKFSEIAAAYGPGGKQAKPEGLGLFTPPYKE